VMMMMRLVMMGWKGLREGLKLVGVSVRRWMGWRKGYGFPGLREFGE
jgi:hypothetical protein